jgi:uncharacterized lipoprotein
MKKIIALTIGAVAIVGLSGCSKTETTNTAVETNTVVDNGVVIDETTNVSSTTNESTGNSL